MSEEGNEEGLGALFDDSPDSEAESEPSSPQIMSAAWVERMARNPGLQRRHPGVDLVSALGRLDLAERRQLRSVVAGREEAEVRVDAMMAQVAEARAQVAEAEARLDAALDAALLVERMEAERARRRSIADAELRAQINRHFAEVHANDQFPAGG